MHIFFNAFWCRLASQQWPRGAHLWGSDSVHELHRAHRLPPAAKASLELAQARFPLECGPVARSPTTLTALSACLKPGHFTSLQL